MAAPTRANTMVGGEVVDADRINQDFDAIYAWAAEHDGAVGSGANTAIEHLYQAGEVDLTSGTYTAWPYASESVEIPAWARYATVLTSVSLKYFNGPSSNYVRQILGPHVGVAWQWGMPHIFGEVATDGTLYGYDTVSISEQFYVAAEAGTTVQIGTEGRRFAQTGVARSSLRSQTVIFTS